MTEHPWESTWAWTGWEDGEELDPPEPGKQWLTICHNGDEYAVIVHRHVEGLDNDALMSEKEERAKLIVHALRAADTHDEGRQA